MHPDNSRLRLAARLARSVRLLVLDIDGVLTDGGLHYDACGKITKRYNVLDGVGIVLLHQVGLKVAVVTAGEDGPCVTERIRRLKVDALYEGNVTKQAALEDLRRRFGVDWKEMAYMGDDWVDLVPLSLVGLPISVPNGRPEVRARALYITHVPGGSGAVREVAEWLLRCRGEYEAVLKAWSTPAVLP